MSFGGHVIDMINRDRANRALKNLRKERYQKIKEAYATKVSHTKEELEKIKQEIREEIRNNQRTAFIKTIGVTITIIVILIYLIKMIV